MANNNEDDLITIHYEDDERNNAIVRVNLRYKERKMSPELVSALILDMIRSCLTDHYKLKNPPRLLFLYWCTSHRSSVSLQGMSERLLVWIFSMYSTGQLLKPSPMNFHMARTVLETF